MKLKQEQSKPFDKAIRDNAIDKVRKLSPLVEINAPFEGNYFLLTAAELGHLGIVNFLLSVEGIDVNISSQKQPHALIVLCSKPVKKDLQALHLKTINALLAKNANVNAEFTLDNGKTINALSAAIDNGLVDIAKRFLLCKNLSEQALRLGLNAAVQKGDLALVQAFVKRGAKPTAETFEKIPAPNSEITAFLTQKFPDVNVVVPHANEALVVPSSSAEGHHSQTRGNLEEKVEKTIPLVPNSSEDDTHTEESVGRSFSDRAPQGYSLFNASQKSNTEHNNKAPGADVGSAHFPNKDALLRLIDVLISKNSKSEKKQLFKDLRKKIVEKDLDYDAFRNAAKNVVMLSLQRTIFGFSNTTTTGKTIRKLINTEANRGLRELLFPNRETAVTYRDLRTLVAGTNMVKAFSSCNRKHMFTLFANKAKNGFVSNEDIKTHVEVVRPKS